MGVEVKGWLFIISTSQHFILQYYFLPSFFLFLSSFYFFLLVVAPSEYLFWIVTRPSVTWNWFDSCISAFCHDHLNVMHVQYPPFSVDSPEWRRVVVPTVKEERNEMGRKKKEIENEDEDDEKVAGNSVVQLPWNCHKTQPVACVQPSQKQLLKVEGFHKQSDEREHSRKKKEDEKGRERERDGKE